MIFSQSADQGYSDLDLTLKIGYVDEACKG